MSLLSSEATSKGNFTRQTVHRILFIATLSCLAIGLSVSKVFISVAELVLGLNWLAEGNILAKWKRFTSNKPALVLCSFYILHLLGLLYTTDFKFGMEDVRVKVPLLILPFLFCTAEPLNEKERNIVMGLFMGGITFASFVGTYRLIHHGFIDIRSISPYVSAVRLALMIVLSVFLLMGYIFTKKFSWLSVILLVWIGWFMAFMVIMESLTGIIQCILIAIILLVYMAYKKARQHKPVYGIVLLAFIGVIFISAGIFLVNFHKRYFPSDTQIKAEYKKDSAAHAMSYFGNVAFNGTENGHIVGAYIKTWELYRCWPKRSKIPLDSVDRKGNRLLYTIARYMTSMNLPKDSVGISKLTDNDVRAIENGIPNYNFASASNVEFRLYQAFWDIEDYRAGGNPSGHSITQRLEFWRAAVGIIQKHWLVGVGTGNVRIAFDKQYDDMHSELRKEFRLRSHNQFLEIGVAFGIIGIIWLLFSVIYPGFKTRKIYSYTYFVFWLIFMFSMCSEDTLETQAGVTFYAFFNSFFLFLV